MIRVIAVPRDDFNEIPGGDRVMLEQIRTHASRYGVHIDIVLPKQLSDWTERADAIYITQIYQRMWLGTALDWAKASGLPVFVSPLVEDHLPHWFAEATEMGGLWRILAATLGPRNAEHIYVSWRHFRQRQSSDWHMIRAVLTSVHLMPNSQYELDHLRRLFHLRRMQASIVPLGIDSRLFNAQTENPSIDQLRLENYVLSVGLISRRKNQLGLLRACHDLDETLVFVGTDSPYETDYCDRVRALAAHRGRVVFLDRVTSEELVTLYRKAKVHVLPSWSERPGLVTLEAAAAGCRVVSTSISPIREYLGSDVILCDPRSTKSIRGAIEQALTTKPPVELRRRLLQYHTWENTAAAFAQVIHKTL